MLSFEHKQAIFWSFHELKEVPVSHDRINYVLPTSKKRGKTVARELHRSGNGYVCGRYMGDYPTDARGWGSIKHLDETQLREVVRKAINSMRG